jgi:hypothetical protein
MCFSAPSIPEPPPPPPPPPPREDPAIAERAKEVSDAEKRRKGRRASILAPAEDDLGAPPVDRPSAQVLG